MKTFKLHFPTTVLAVCLFITGICCKKKTDNPIDKLPPLTTTGADTFGCLINGEAFVPKVSFGPRGALETSVGSANGKIFIGISARNNKSKIEKYILLFINSSKIDVGNYTLIQDNVNRDNSFAIYNSQGPKEALGKDYMTNSLTPGNVSINYYNKEEGILSGTFSFNGTSERGEKVEVREGRFDLKL